MHRRIFTALATLTLATLTACSSTPQSPSPSLDPTPAPTTPEVIYHEPSDPPIEREPFTGNLTAEETSLLLTTVWADTDRESQESICWGWDMMGSDWSLDHLRRGLGGAIVIDDDAAIAFFTLVCD